MTNVCEELASLAISNTGEYLAEVNLTKAGCNSVTKLSKPWCDVSLPPINDSLPLLLHRRQKVQLTEGLACVLDGCLREVIERQAASTRTKVATKVSSRIVTTGGGIE